MLVTDDGVMEYTPAAVGVSVVARAVQVSIAQHDLNARTGRTMFLVASLLIIEEVPLKVAPTWPIEYIVVVLDSVDDQYPELPIVQLLPILRSPVCAGYLASSIPSLRDGMNQSEYPVVLDKLNELTLPTAPPRQLAFAKLVLVSPQPIPCCDAPIDDELLEQ
jgi:hypothetical protein